MNTWVHAYWCPSPLPQLEGVAMNPRPPHTCAHPLWEKTNLKVQELIVQGSLKKKKKQIFHVPRTQIRCTEQIKSGWICHWNEHMSYRWVEKTRCLLDLQVVWILKKIKLVRHQWLMPVILATQEAEIRRLEVPSQSRQIVCETLSWKYHKKELAE
jgi:hypothetical protein